MVVVGVVGILRSILGKGVSMHRSELASTRLAGGALRRLKLTSRLKTKNYLNFTSHLTRPAKRRVISVSSDLMLIRVASSRLSED